VCDAVCHAQYIYGSVTDISLSVVVTRVCQRRLWLIMSFWMSFILLSLSFCVLFVMWLICCMLLMQGLLAACHIHVISRHHPPPIHTVSVTFDVHTLITEMMPVAWCVC